MPTMLARRNFQPSIRRGWIAPAPVEHMGGTPPYYERTGATALQARAVPEKPSESRVIARRARTRAEVLLVTAHKSHKDGPYRVRLVRSRA